ncbi:hypothetical protein ACGF07_31985 [Kitasatospora sp. NPDC048194]|uniref:hypothetical protein n=1 Tax=Kitasatospora sp. NPDC048194 TaxID=3364045 RepID=UPI00371AE876
MSQLLHVLSAAMDSHQHILAAADSHSHILADPTPKPAPANPIPDYTPTLPDNVKNPTGTILGWVAGGGLALAVLGGLAGWACIGVGENTDRGALAAKGKKAVIMSLIAGGGIAVTSGLVWSVYTMAV